MSDWPFVRLGDLAINEKSAISKPYGSAIVKEDYISHGIPVVRGVNLARGIFHDDDFVFISEQLADSMPGSRLAPGDLIFTHRGSIGQVSMIPRKPRYRRYAVSTSQVKARLDPDRAVPEFYYYWFKSPLGRHSILQGSSTVGVPGLAQPVATIKALLVPHPPLNVQRGIAITLGVLDDKIGSNQRARILIRQLGSAQLQASVTNDSYTACLGDVTSSIARGVAPKYADHDLDSAVVLNQKCIRGGWVDTYFARRLIPKNVAPERRASSGDVLVNSTGTGTLGRLGRWHKGDVFVDGHVTVVKASTKKVSPTVLAYALFGREPDIVNMATGSTGQTELSPSRLAQLELRLPHIIEMSSIEKALLDFEEHIFSLGHEESTLSQLRDALLSGLLSGRIRVSEAAEAIGESVA